MERELIKAYCDICGKDITRTMKFYINGTRMCYDCIEEYDKRSREERRLRRNERLKTGR